MSYLRLPEELFARIFEELEVTAPSIIRARDEPDFHLTSSLTQDLKNVSLVSRKWRRIVLPLLFKYARLKIKSLVDHDREFCLTCREMREDTAPASSWSSQPYIRSIRLEADSDSRRDRNLSRFANSIKQIADWIRELEHSYRDFIKFIRTARLAATARSFVLLNEVAGAPDAPTEDHESKDLLYSAIASFWRHVLAVLGPSRIVIVASPANLISLTNASVRVSGDWCYRGRTQLLDLRSLKPAQTSMDPKCFDEDCVIPDSTDSFAKESIVRSRQWEEIGLNEGSYLDAYSSYQYFEWGPPHTLCSIRACFSGKGVGWMSGASGYPAPCKKFAYTAVFPFSDHMHFGGLLPHVEELDLQLAPSPNSDSLHDHNKSSYADLLDCWHELTMTYNDLAFSTNTDNISAAQMSWLRRLIVRDIRIQALRGELDDIFTQLCLPVWAEYQPGIYERLIPSLITQ